MGGANSQATRQILRRWHDLIVANLDDLAAILVAEMGKPLAEAQGEILYGAAYAEWYAEEAKRLYGDIIPGHQADKQIVVLRQPVRRGRRDYRLEFSKRDAHAQDRASACVRLRNDFQTGTADAIVRGRTCCPCGTCRVPPGLLSVIPTTDAASFGVEICQNDKVRKLTFTGSTQVGRILMRQAADHVMKLSLELGGNAPFIVFDDADIEAAVDGAIQSKFRNGGQTCVCANRIYVQSAVYEEFAARLAERVRGLRVGDGFEPNVDLGPLIDANAVSKVRRHIDDATRLGAKVVVGGDTLRQHGPLFFAPTVMTDVTGQMLVAREETFGPLAPLFRFESIDQVVQLANNTEFGLAGYFYTRDVGRAWRVAEELEYGMVGINTGLISTEVAPFGGVKQSGVGREGSKYGLHDFTEMKYVCFSV